VLENDHVVEDDHDGSSDVSDDLNHEEEEKDTILITKDSEGELNDEIVLEKDDVLKKKIEDGKKGLLPKSEVRYRSSYVEFKEWCNKFNVKEPDSKICIAYLNDLLTSGRFGISSLWAVWSGIKSIMLNDEEKDIDYPNFKKWLKQKQKGQKHKAKRAKVFTREDLETFRQRADIDKHLRELIALDLGLFGRLRSEDYVELKHENISVLLDDKSKEEFLKIDYYKGKSVVPHTFFAYGKVVELYKLYKSKTEKFHHGNGRVFWQERKGKGHGQVLGKAWFQKYPRTIAAICNLPDISSYSGHSICRTGGTFMGDSGASLLELKKYGCWKSDQVAQIYVDESQKMKKDAAMRIMVGKGLKEIEKDDIVNDLKGLVTEELTGKKRSLEEMEQSVPVKKQRIIGANLSGTGSFVFDSCTFESCNFGN